MNLKNTAVKVTFCVTIATAGCSPYAYEKELTSFSNSTNAIASGIEEIQTELIAQPGNEAFWKAYSQPDARVELSPTACANVNPKPTERCTLRVAAKEVRLTTLSQAILSSIKQLDGLSGYASALASVAKAKDRADFDAASAQLATNLSTFIGLAGGASGAIVSPVVQAGFSLQALSFDRARLKQMQLSVAAVDAKLPAAAPRLTQALIALRNARIKAVSRRMTYVEDAVENATTTTERGTLVRELQSGAAEIARLQANSPGKAVEAMVKAHNTLANALEKPKPDLASIAKELSTFAEFAEQFNAANAAD